MSCLFPYSIRYPPYSSKKEEWFLWILKKSPKKKGLMSYLPIMVLGVVIAFIFKVSQISTDRTQTMEQEMLKRK